MASAIASRMARTAGALALVSASAPAAAEQARAILSVTAIVAPACAIRRAPAREPGAAIACSTGATVSTMTASRHDEQPLDEAAAILGQPVRRGRGVAFTAPARSAAATARGGGGTRYLTLTY
jgi:hypothetical protein